MCTCAKRELYQLIWIKPATCHVHRWFANPRIFKVEKLDIGTHPTQVRLDDLPNSMGRSNPSDDRANQSPEHAIFDPVLHIDGDVFSVSGLLGKARDLEFGEVVPVSACGHRFTNKRHDVDEFTNPDKISEIRLGIPHGVLQK